MIMIRFMGLLIALYCFSVQTIFAHENEVPDRVGGVRWTIKDGIVYDAFKLRADVRETVPCR